MEDDHAIPTIIPASMDGGRITGFPALNGEVRQDACFITPPFMAGFTKPTSIGL